MNYPNQQLVNPPIFEGNDPTIHIPNTDDGVSGMLNASERYYLGGSPVPQSQNSFDSNSPMMDIPMPMSANLLDPQLPWDMIAMGLEEALPAQEIVDSLYVSRAARLLATTIILTMYKDIEHILKKYIHAFHLSIKGDISPVWIWVRICDHRLLYDTQCGQWRPQYQMITQVFRHIFTALLESI